MKKSVKGEASKGSGRVQNPKVSWDGKKQGPTSKGKGFGSK